MNQYEHNCPYCKCLNPDGPAEWMAARLIQADNPIGYDIYTTHAYESYRQWVIDNPHPGQVVFTRNQLTRWLRKQGVQLSTQGGKGNRLVGWSFRSLHSSPPAVSDLT